MSVRTLDHVNIVTTDLSGAVAFYRDILGLIPSDPPEPLKPEDIRWLNDAEGRPIVHMVRREFMERREYFVDNVGNPTGSIDHVAFDCDGLDDMKARLDAAGLDYRVSGVSGIRLTQLFVRDPNNVLLELNFRG
ncbi:glyoxalase [Croceicoccus ponticola]|uniref:Glyoxalase n=1 Tax=Croceicoccus ponticola TaxID=2217664 RepID=A0A437GX60_9SPHN|nr:VOC family protein [Croceicoccus ponticola]RVQ66964.1 glyoxalase [Croceicoccus ponticola]